MSEVRDEIEKDLGIVDITPTDLQDDILVQILLTNIESKSQKKGRWGKDEPFIGLS